MTTDRPYPRLPLVGFGVLLPAIYATSLLIVGSQALARDPGVVAGAVTLDLTILIPALFYLLVARTASLPAISVVPVFLLSLLGASFVLPVEHQSVLDRVERLLVPAELLLLGYVGVRAYRGVRTWTPAEQRVDLVERLWSLLRRMTPHPAVAGAAAHEIAMLYYAFLSWRSKPDVVAGELAFPYHRKNGYIGVLAAAALVGMVEMVAVHLLVEPWSASVAWGLTAASVYGLVWLLGYLQAIRLRPILLTQEELHIRIGLLWSVRNPNAQVVHVLPAERNAPERSGKEYLHAVTMGPTQVVLELRETVAAQGLYGYRKRGVKRIGIAVDEQERFVRELKSRVDAAA